MATRVRSRAAAPQMAELPGTIGLGTLPSQLHNIIEDAIVQGVLQPGQRLSADDLAERYGVSRIPVREALSSLDASGWVEIRPRYGVYVRQRSDRELTELFAVRAVIEPFVARCAAKQRSEDDLQALQDVVARSKQAARRPDQSKLDWLNGEFYAALRIATCNHVLATTSESLEKRARFYFSTVSESLGVGWVDTHEALVAAIAAKRVKVAESIAREHIISTGEAVHRLLTHHE